ncbi:MAG: hypothetical protein U0414_24565 [Polyangiaceae bacterium]
MQTSRALRALAALVMLSSFAGCFPNPSDGASECTAEGPAFDGEHALILGTTTRVGAFSPVFEGREIEISLGSQGLQHLGYAALVHTGGEELTLLATFTRDDGVVIGRDSRIIESCDETWLELTDARLVLDRNEFMEGTLAVQIGTCPEAGCPTGADGEYVLAVVRGEVSVHLKLDEAT